MGRGPPDAHADDHRLADKATDRPRTGNCAQGGHSVRYGQERKGRKARPVKGESKSARGKIGW